MPRIANTLCPYCSVRMVKAENLPSSRSVEHLVPNTLTRQARGNGDGDFYACRSCNSRKGHMDYLLAVISKGQSRDDALAAEVMIKAVTGEDGRAVRFKRMLETLRETPDGGAEFTMPISGPELLEYMQFLGKGQYFRKYRRIFQPDREVMLVGWSHKAVGRAIEDDYEARFGSNPFRDLEQNRYSEVISGGDCILYTKNNNFLFVFHDYIAVTVSIKRRNPKNTARELECNARILDDFSTYPAPPRAA